MLRLNGLAGAVAGSFGDPARAGLPGWLAWAGSLGGLAGVVASGRLAEAVVAVIAAVIASRETVRVTSMILRLRRALVRRGRALDLVR